MSFEVFFRPEETPYTTTNNLKTSNSGNHRLSMHEGEVEIKNRLNPRKSQQDIQNLNTYMFLKHQLL